MCIRMVFRELKSSGGPIEIEDSPPRLRRVRRKSSHFVPPDEQASNCMPWIKVHVAGARLEFFRLDTSVTGDPVIDYTPDLHAFQ